MQVFNAKTQQLEDVTWSIDLNQELVATFADKTFVKFPRVEGDELEALIAQHHEANEGQEVITPEQEKAMADQQDANEKLLAQLNGNTMPDQDKTNADQDHTDN